MGGSIDLIWLAISARRDSASELTKAVRYGMLRDDSPHESFTPIYPGFISWPPSTESGTTFVQKRRSMR